MKLFLDPGQAMLARTAHDFAAKHHPIDRLRALRDAHDPLGYSPEVWTEMADLGWTGIPFSEADGGLGMGMAELVLITEALGETLAPEPMISAIAFAAGLISAAGTTKQKEQWLTPTIAGTKRLAVAYLDRGAQIDSGVCSTTAEENGKGWILNGTKAHIIDGFQANGWIVSARIPSTTDDSNGVSLFVVPADRNGATCTRQWRVDSRNAASLDLSDVVVTSADLLGEQGSGSSLLAAAIERATVAMCGEMLGIAREAFHRTVEYLKTREQFGTKIGTFQALQHRAALLFVEIELCKSAVMAAARKLDDPQSTATERTIQVANAKARCSDAIILVTNEALQMHGGLGMTDEYDIGLLMKRARVCELTFGDAAYHRDRFARASGY